MNNSELLFFLLQTFLLVNELVSANCHVPYYW